MSVLGHIRDLRKCLINCCWCFLITSCVAFYFREELYHFLYSPYFDSIKDKSNTKITYGTVFSSFTVSLNISLIAGIILGMPYALFEIFRFIAPGLEKKEVKLFYIFSTLGSLLFLLGVFLSYSYLIPRLAEVMERFQFDDTVAYLSAKDFLKTILKLILGIGLIFQFPLVLFFAVKIGLLQLETLRSNRKIIFIGILIISAFVTPPDPLSMAIIATPFYGMFELTLVACRFFIKD